MDRENVKVRGVGAAGDPRVARLLFLATLMDSQIELPGTGLRIGLDPLLGLIPGVGDVVTTFVSLYIVYEARKLGATDAQVRAMLLNVLIDFAIGEIPVLGDLFDFAFKANLRNLAIMGFSPEDLGGRAGRTSP
ncbi:MAG: DUF4112 domain-containing protein [Phycisphaerales bacterium]